MQFVSNILIGCVIQGMKMKRVFFLTLILSGFCFITGCGRGGVQSLPQIQGTEITEISDQGKYSDDIVGLENYLKDCGAIVGDGVDMSSRMIGAISGKKYVFKFNDSNVSVEIYDFGDELEEDLKGKALETKNSVLQSGNITILNKQIPAVLSDNQKYLMMYSDDSGESKNKERKQKIIELFKKFRQA